MPRYRFHLYNDEETMDEEGRHFDDFRAAHLEAIGNARELMCTDLRAKGVINLSHWIEMEDDRGEITVVAFWDAVIIKS